MFKKLHFRLTLFNAIILVFFMVFFSLVVYFFVNKLVFFPVDSALMASARRVTSLNQIPLEKEGSLGLRPPRTDHYENPKNQEEQKLWERLAKDRFMIGRASLRNFYILRDSSLKVQSSSEEAISFEVQALKAAREVSQENRPRIELLTTQDGMLRLWTGSFHKNDGGIVQVYQFVDREINFLYSLMAIFLLVGLVSIFVLVTIGWVLAGKSLVPVKKAWRQQQEFIADASHELRTPLTVMGTNLEVILGNQEQKVSENQVWLNNIVEENRMMTKLVNDLLTLAEMDASQLKLKKEKFDLSALVEEKAEEMKLLFSRKQIIFTKNVPPKIEITGDRMRVKQLLGILLDNAAKYTPEGGTVRLSVKDELNRVWMMLQDSGPGIDEEDQERIFERFYRIDKARSRTLGGTGLGLGIARWIVLAHGGKISVKSNPGEGATFIVELNKISPEKRKIKWLSKLWKK